MEIDVTLHDLVELWDHDKVNIWTISGKDQGLFVGLVVKAKEQIRYDQR